MFRRYHRAANCYGYPPDVLIKTDDGLSDPNHAWISSFRRSRWFTSGWTLQELLAPKIVEFFSLEKTLLGTKQTLATQLLFCDAYHGCLHAFGQYLLNTAQSSIVRISFRNSLNMTLYVLVQRRPSLHKDLAHSVFGGEETRSDIYQNSFPFNKIA